jgi:hypothetical protein
MPHRRARGIRRTGRGDGCHQLAGVGVPVLRALGAGRGQLFAANEKLPLDGDMGSFPWFSLGQAPSVTGHISVKLVLALVGEREPRWTAVGRGSLVHVNVIADGEKCTGTLAAISPHTPFRAQMAITMAIPPRIIRYHALYWAMFVSRTLIRVTHIM